MKPEIRLIAFDLDGTLTQHKSPLGAQNRSLLERLQKEYRLLMVGAGSCERIFKQMGNFPLDIIGNYGMQYAEWDEAQSALAIRFSEVCDVDRDEVLRRAEAIRKEFGLHEFKGETLEIHASGMLTFPILGTKAEIQDKLAYDPDRAKRRVMYPFVRKLFHDYTVFIGGSSSFDIVPNPFCKSYALERYMQTHGLSPENVVYCGDDYKPGGNDHDVHQSAVSFVEVDDYRSTEALLVERGLL
jgi:HAD superfamily hydrolase (TIGR01484 family)